MDAPRGWFQNVFNERHRERRELLRLEQQGEAGGHFGGSTTSSYQEYDQHSTSATDEVSTCSSFHMLLISHVAHLTCYSFHLLLISHVAHFTCCSFHMLLISHFTHFTCCSFPMLHISYVTHFTC